MGRSSKPAHVGYRPTTVHAADIRGPLTEKFFHQRAPRNGLFSVGNFRWALNFVDSARVRKEIRFLNRKLFGAHFHFLVTSARVSASTFVFPMRVKEEMKLRGRGTLASTCRAARHRRKVWSPRRHSTSLERLSWRGVHLLFAFEPGNFGIQIERRDLHQRQFQRNDQRRLHFDSRRFG